MPWTTFPWAGDDAVTSRMTLAPPLPRSDAANAGLWGRRVSAKILCSSHAGTPSDWGLGSVNPLRASHRDPAPWRASGERPCIFRSGPVLIRDSIPHPGNVTGLAPWVRDPPGFGRMASGSSSFPSRALRHRGGSLPSRLPAACSSGPTRPGPSTWNQEVAPVYGSDNARDREGSGDSGSPIAHPELAGIPVDCGSLHDGSSGKRLWNAIPSAERLVAPCHHPCVARLRPTPPP